MSTRKLSDKEFDRYAKNLLKKPEGVAFDKAAWAAMEQQLSQAGTSSSVFSLKWLIPLGIVVLSTVLYFLVQGSNEFETVPSEIESNLENSPEEESLGLSENQNIEDSISSVETSDLAVALNQLNHANSNNHTSEEGASYEESELASRENKSEPPEQLAESLDKDVFKNQNLPSEKPIVEEETNNVASSSGLSKTKRLVQNTNTVVENEENPTSSNQPEVTFQKEDGSTRRNVPDDLESKPVVLQLSSIDDSRINPNRIESDKGNSRDSVSTEETEISSYKHWSIGLTLAPDFSTVGQLNEFTQPGIDVGLTVEYFIAKRLSISSGAILTRKLYNTTDIGEYTVPAGFWNGAGAPEEITADCRVVDIPINLRYRLIEGKRTSLFVSAGVSSYLMLNEQYDYSYGYGQGNGNEPTAWEVSNENNHFFGVYNLSAGISRRVSQNIYIEAEPFLKNSLGGVGWGQVRLKSTGVLFHVKYNF